MENTCVMNVNRCVKPAGCSFFCAEKYEAMNADVQIVTSVFVLLSLCLSIALCIIILALLLM